MADSPFKVIGNILMQQMSLLQSQIWVWNTEFKYPNNETMFIALQFINSRQIVNNRAFESTNTTAKEIIYTMLEEEYYINIMSKTTEARDRMYEVGIALHSTYSSQLQNANGITIYPVQKTIIDASTLEGGGMYQRYIVPVKLLRSIEKQFEVDYYDKIQSTSLLTKNYNISLAYHNHTINFNQNVIKNIYQLVYSMLSIALAIPICIIYYYIITTH